MSGKSWIASVDHLGSVGVLFFNGRPLQLIFLVVWGSYLSMSEKSWTAPVDILGVWGSYPSTSDKSWIASVYHLAGECEGVIFLDCFS